MRFNQGSARMFRNPWLERLSHVHPATPAVIFVPAIAFGLYQSFVTHALSPAAVAGRLLLGYVLWTLTEYWLHRLVFHLPVRGPLTRKIYFYLHGVHHDWPWDHTRLVLPPSVSVLLAAGFFFLFRALLGPVFVWPWFTGYLAGYLLYDTLHWYAHAGRPRNRLARYLRREHLVHHFQQPDTRFGVSCPWWDHVFGTAGPPTRTGRSRFRHG